MKPTPAIKCPTCKNSGKWFDSAYGPFCSKRCKLVDLGKWFGEEQRISEPLRPEHFVALDEEESRPGTDREENS